MKINVTDRAGATTSLPYAAGDSLMEILAEADLVEAICGGECSCATCQVYVDENWLDELPAQDGMEVELLDELLNTKASSRLACQIVLTENLDGLNVEVARAE